MKNKTIIYEIALFILIAISFDFVYGRLVQFLFSKTKQTTKYGDLFYAVNKAQPQLLVLGSSRAKYHYDPRIIGDSLKMSVYNAGCDDKGILYFSCVGSAILNRNKTKYVLIDLLNNEFNDKFLDPIHVVGLELFYNKDSLFYTTVNLDDHSKKIKMISNYYRYNNSFYEIIHDCVGKINPLSHSGYCELPPIHMSPVYKNNAKSNINPILLQRLLFFLRMCKQKGAIPVIAMSPLYGSVNSETINQISSICK